MHHTEPLFETGDTVLEISGSLAGLQRLPVVRAVDTDDGHMVTVAIGSSLYTTQGHHFRLIVKAPSLIAVSSETTLDRLELRCDHVSERARREAKAIDAEQFVAAALAPQTVESQILTLRRDITIADGDRQAFEAEAAERDVTDRQLGRDDAATSRIWARRSQIKADRLRAELDERVSLDTTVSTLEASWGACALQAAE